MKKIFFVLLIIFMAVLWPNGLLAQEQEQTRILAGKQLGLIFNVSGLLLNIIEEHQDSIQGGLGMKLWIGDKSALRGILDFNHTNLSGTRDTLIGISAAYEYHFLRRRVSPYGGALAGTQVRVGTANDVSLYLGAILGAEFELVENVGLFGEYSLLVNINEPLFAIDLGLGNNAQIGIVVYLN